MKYSAFYLIVAGLALGAMLLPRTVLAEKKTPFIATETDKTQNFAWFTDTSGESAYVFDGSATFDIESEESRVTGSGWYSMYAIVDLNTGATTLWGKLHSENTDGAWDGYWTGTEAGFSATCVGSGDYEGLVSLWQCTPTSDVKGVYNWRGYIVENGQGEVPLKMSGWRTEQFVPLKLIEGNPVHVKACLDAGGGQASHIGVFTDLRKIGLVNLLDGIFSATGTLRAANGDLLNWVTIGTMAGPPAVEVFFVGGTGRFEHAFGSFAGPLQYQSPELTSYTYKGTGKIRY